MKIIQRGRLKFLTLTLAMVASIVIPSFAQVSSHRLRTADSLFQAKRYTQSLEHYEEILRQHQYTPAMLLKMAYVHEGLNQMGSAMYYLNLYHLATRDESAIQKMNEIAQKLNLRGYEPSDSDRFHDFYLDNHLWISLSLAALILLSLSIAYYTRRRRHERPIGSAIAVMTLSTMLAVHLYYGSTRTHAIIATETTYVMNGPSAGASVVEVVGDGHKVEVIGRKDVWLKVKWDNSTAYIKESAVKELSL
jgi:hypothetical protein